jgi:hypothetical protein
MGLQILETKTGRQVQITFTKDCRLFMEQDYDFQFTGSRRDLMQRIERDSVNNDCDRYTVLDEGGVYSVRRE